MTLHVNPPSLDGSANTLLELAGLLHAGRPEPGLTDRARTPYAHREVAAATRTLVAFAADQYQDAVALLAALSTRLANAATGYSEIDKDAARRIAAYLDEPQLQPADQRPR